VRDVDIIDRIGAAASRDGDRAAHRYRGESLSYAQLWSASSALAARIVGMLPDDGSPVVVYGHKESAMLVAFLGAVRAAGTDGARHLQNAGAAGARRADGMNCLGFGVSAGNHAVAVEPVRVRQCQGRLGAGDLNEAGALERRVETEDALRGLTAGELRDGTDMRWDCDLEDLSHLGAGSNDPGRPRLRTECGDLGNCTECLDQSREVVGPDVEERTGSFLEEKRRIWVP